MPVRIKLKITEQIVMGKMRFFGENTIAASGIIAPITKAIADDVAAPHGLLISFASMPDYFSIS